MKNRVFVNFIVISLFSFSLPLYAQVKVTNHDDYFSGGSGGAPDEGNIIKIGFTHIFDGELPFYYERRINNNLTVQAAAGVTFYNFFGDFTNLLNSANLTDNPPPATYSLGYTLKLGIRYYPTSEAPEGFYLSPEIRYKVYNYSYNNVTTGYDSLGNPMTGNLTGRASYFDFVGTAGYQFISQFNMVYDVYAGFGGRVRNVDVINETTDAFGNSSFYFTKQSGLVPFFTIGVTVGVAF